MREARGDGVSMQCSSCGAARQRTANFCPACGVRLDRAPTVEARSPETAPQPVKVLDAGGRLMLTGLRGEDVQEALEKYLAEGAHLITDLCQVGKTWTAACTLPPKKRAMADTQSLSLAELQEALVEGIPAPVEDPELAQDGCRIEEVGFKRIIYGPSKEAVQRRYEHMRRCFGAELVGEVERTEAEWSAVCDTGGVDPGYRWTGQGPS
jgi:hypothetical protein